MLLVAVKPSRLSLGYPGGNKVFNELWMEFESKFWKAPLVEWAVWSYLESLAWKPVILE